MFFWAKTFSSVLTYECKKLYFIGLWFAFSLFVMTSILASCHQCKNYPLCLLCFFAFSFLGICNKNNKVEEVLGGCWTLATLIRAPWRGFQLCYSFPSAVPGSSSSFFLDPASFDHVSSLPHQFFQEVHSPEFLFPFMPLPALLPYFFVPFPWLGIERTRTLSSGLSWTLGAIHKFTSLWQMSESI